MIDRKKFFKKGFTSIIKAINETKKTVDKVPEIIKENLIEQTKPEDEERAFKKIPEYTRKKKVKKNLFFVPGSLKPEEKFASKCTSCGDCTNACPHDTIFPIYMDKYNKSLPFIDPNFKACLMCKDVPCINSCNTGALKKFKNSFPKLGKAKLIFDYCINSRSEVKCNVCIQACPVPNAIFQKKDKPIISKDCTGCGICVQNCPTFPKALVIKEL